MPKGPTRRASSSVHHRSSSRQHGLAGWLVALVDCRSMPARPVWTPSVCPQCCTASRLSCPRSDAHIKLCLLPPPTLLPPSLSDHARLGGLQFSNISSTAAEILRQSWRPWTKSLPASTMSITKTTRPTSTMSFTSPTRLRARPLRGHGRCSGSILFSLLLTSAGTFPLYFFKGRKRERGTEEVFHHLLEKGHC